MALRRFKITAFLVLKYLEILLAIGLAVGGYCAWTIGAVFLSAQKSMIGPRGSVFHLSKPEEFASPREFTTQITGSWEMTSFANDGSK